MHCHMEIHRHGRGGLRRRLFWGVALMLLGGGLLLGEIQGLLLLPHLIALRNVIVL